MTDDLHFFRGPIRPDAQSVHVYSDGPVGFLYDASFEPVLKASAPAILFGAGHEEFREPATRAALAAGRLIVYGMVGDVGAHADIVVGTPLTAAERGDGVWIDDAGWLDLPSGRLCVHTYDSLPIGDGAPDTDGGIVVVPPGRYRVRMHRKDWSATAIDWFERADAAGLDENARIDDVIVLERLADGEAPPAVPNILFGDQIGFEPEVVPPSVGRIVDGVFHGSVIDRRDDDVPSLAIDLTAAQVAELGLAPGDHLELETAAGPLVAYFHGPLANAFGFARLFGRERALALAGGSGVDAYEENARIPVAKKVAGHESWLRVCAQAAQPAAFAAPVGSSVTLRRGAPAPDLPNPKKAKLKDDALHGEVVASHPAGLAVNIDSTLLRKLVSGEDVRLELDVGGTVLPVAYQPMLVSKVVKTALRQSPLLLVASWEGHWRDRKKNVLVFVPWVDRMIEPEKRKAPPALPVFPAGTPIVLRRA